MLCVACPSRVCRGKGEAKPGGGAHAERQGRCCVFRNLIECMSCCSLAPQCVPRAAPCAALPDRRARASPRNGIQRTPRGRRAPASLHPCALAARQREGGTEKGARLWQLLILRAAAPPSRRAAPAAGLCPGATCRSSCRSRRRVGAWPSRESSPRTRWRPSATTRCVCVPGGGVALSDTTYVASPRRVARPRMCYKHH